MKIYNSVDQYESEERSVATLGTFDGLHIGHRKIIERLVRTANADGHQSLVMTFFPHPRMVIQPDAPVRLLTTPAEKNALLAPLNLDVLVVQPFNAEFANLEAEEFVRDVLVGKLNISKIIIGHDHHFGKNRSAGIEDLLHFGKKYGFEVEQIPAQEINDISVSSTKIRKAISEGDIALANQFLGYNYLLTGLVTEGKKLGRTIGFPTANIQIDESFKLLPKKGVYVVEAELGNRALYGMMNIGTNPTVNGKALSVEVHLFDFEGDLYGKEIKVMVLHRLRDEQKFESIDDLKAQLHQDKAASIAYVTAS